MTTEKRAKFQRASDLLIVTLEKHLEDLPPANAAILAHYGEIRKQVLVAFLTYVLRRTSGDLTPKDMEEIVLLTEQALLSSGKILTPKEEKIPEELLN